MIINYNEQSIVTFMYNNEEWLRKKKKTDCCVSTYTKLLDDSLREKGKSNESLAVCTE